MKNLLKIGIVLTGIVVLGFGTAQAQTAASNKAFFAGNKDTVKLAGVSGKGWSEPITLFDLNDTLKTSNVGGVTAILSMEAALWTYNVTTDINLGGKSSSSSRAAIKAWVEIDGKMMEPGKVVYADRLQATGLDLNLQNLTCTDPILDENGAVIGCENTDSLTMELFQRTKNANAFTFFLGPLPAQVHDVKVKAQAMIECRETNPTTPTAVIDCPQAILDGYNAKTAAAIGKASILIEEQNNWGTAQ